MKSKPNAIPENKLFLDRLRLIRSAARICADGEAWRDRLDRWLEPMSWKKKKQH